MRRLPEVVWGRVGAVGDRRRCSSLTLPLWLSTSRLNLATIIVIFGIVAASLVVLTRLGGPGQPRPDGVRGRRAPPSAGRSPTTAAGTWPLAMLVAGLVGGVAAVIVGYPALRRRGLTLAVSTLAFGLFVSSYLLNRTDPVPARPAAGAAHRPRARCSASSSSSETAMFYACLAVLALAPDHGGGPAAQPHRAGAHRHPREREGRPRLRRQRHPHEPGGVRPVGVPGRGGGRALRPPADRASAPSRTCRSAASSCSRWW